MQKLKTLILTVSHGAAHWRVSDALRSAVLQVSPTSHVEVVDAVALCAPWFRGYYNSYEILLKYCPPLWSWIESIQHQARSTGPEWIYRRGGEPLFRYIRRFDANVVIVTEVGACELAAMVKRETKAPFQLVAVPAGVELADRAWVRPEVDLYVVMPGDLAAQLQACGAPAKKIAPCGIPVDPAFASLPDRVTARVRLGVENHVPLLLVLFGGTGFGRPARIIGELDKLKQPFQAVFITGKNAALEEEIRQRCARRPCYRVLGWVDNMHEWMAAATLAVTKPGGLTIVEAINCGLPLVAFDPLPGAERRACELIEKWQVGCWVRGPNQLATTIARLLSVDEELRKLREHALALARPNAARQAAEIILQMAGSLPLPPHRTETAWPVVEIPS